MRKDSPKLAKSDNRMTSISKHNAYSSLYQVSQVPRMTLVDDEEYFFEVEDF
jgi:hypothetical protein